MALLVISSVIFVACFLVLPLIAFLIDNSSAFLPAVWAAPLATIPPTPTPIILTGSATA